MIKIMILIVKTKNDDAFDNQGFTFLQSTKPENHCSLIFLHNLMIMTMMMAMIRMRMMLLLLMMRMRMMLTVMMMTMTMTMMTVTLTQ